MSTRRHITRQASPSPTRSDNTLAIKRIAPEWTEPTKNYRSWIYSVGIGGILTAEVFGKKFDTLRPSTVLQTLQPYITHVWTNLGYVVAYLSDIAYVFRKVFTFVHDMLTPVYHALRDALCDIVGEVWNLIKTSLLSFFDGYTDGLQGAYNQLMSMMTSILVFAGGFVMLGFLLEGVGLKKGIRAIRPSYYIIKCFANPIYDMTRTVTYWYTKVGSVLSNIRDFVEHVVQRLMPWVRPYITMIKEGGAYVDRAARDLFEAPLQGIARGFTEALTHHRVLTAFITGALLFGTGYIIYHYV